MAPALLVVADFDYYHFDRPHYGLGNDTPVERPVHPKPAKGAMVMELPRVGGRHHRYEWKEAAYGKTVLCRARLSGLSCFQLVPSINLSWLIPRQILRIDSGERIPRLASAWMC
jgi:hypothetical protein